MRDRGSARRVRAGTLGVWALALVVGYTGCATPRTPLPAPGYDRLVDSLGSVDAAPLRGRRIVLDPGHGGRFPGSMGVKGLSEASVNLGVGLALRDLLTNAGAEVRMTRETDRDFLAPADSTLRFDLAERVRIANAFEPELFVSIHHNADAGGRHDVNEIQTYYKLGDEGPSLDVAEDVHRALVRNVGIQAHKVLPGNYYVVRNSVAPAILTETSYITYPPVEERLRLPENQRLEAQALYLGIARYFARPRPEVAEFAAWDLDSARADTSFGGPLELRARIVGEFDVAELRVDDTIVPVVRTGEWIAWRPRAPLEQGAHRATLRVRRTGVGSARERAITFAVRRAPARLALETWPARGFAGNGAFGVRVSVLDEAGTPDPDSAAVRIAIGPRGTKASARRRAASAPRTIDTLAIARDGVAWAYAHTLAPLEARASLGALAARATVGAATDPWAGFLRRMPADTVLAGAPGTREPSPALRWLNRDGFAVLDRDANGAPRAPQLPGFREWGADRAPEVAPSFTAIAGGALHGRRIVLDPDGGGDRPQGIGKGGARAATLNLEVARSLAALLTASGAQVKLTREGDVALAELERVQISESFRADRFLRIGHRAEKPRIGHYFSSAGGKAWGQRLAAECARLGMGSPAVAEDAQYPLQQTSCPSLYASLARIDDPAQETALLAPGALRREAYVLWLALVREWGSDAGWIADSVAVRDSGGRPIAGAAVRLGGALLLETDARGIARFVRTEPGPIEAVVEDPRVRARRVLLDSGRGTVLTGPPEP